MNVINKYKVVIAVVLPVLILVILRSLSINHFRSDAKKWAERSVMRSNIITAEKIGMVQGEKLIINLSKEGSESVPFQLSGINIPEDSILNKMKLKTIRNHKGPVLLYSNETAVSARIWMVLSQLGLKNIFILTISSDNELLKNKFRPDTTARPEL